MHVCVRPGQYLLGFLKLLQGLAVVKQQVDVCALEILGSVELVLE